MSTFFEEVTEASTVKSEIVSKYFFAWSKILKSRSEKLAYIDLFSGPGRYEDGTASTPIKVLERIISDKELAEKVVTVFNDKDKESTSKLIEEIGNIDGINTLVHRPQVTNMEVNHELIKQFENTRLVPTLAFIDPFGYKGLSLQLIKGLMKDWGSDCIFFFNYNRISIGINNPKIENHINDIFGEERASIMREQIKNFKGEDKIAYVINELALALGDNGRNFVLPFQFNNDKRVSHFLIFVSKHETGYKIMKDIMWKASSEHSDGVANFAYIPVENEQLELLFEYARPLDQLGEVLLTTFSRNTLTLQDIFDIHHKGTKFVKPNYKEALRRLEAQGRINVMPPADQRRRYKGELTFPDKTVVSFP